MQRVRVHEMLKCMNVHHERIKVLRQHTDLDDLLLAKQKADGEEEAKARANENYQPVHTDAHGQDDGLEEDEPEEIDHKLRQDIEKKHTEILTRGIDTLFLRTQAEEEEVIASIYPPLKKILADPKYVAKCAVQMFRNRADITKDEFEAIIELCRDRLEKQALRDAFEENKNREKYLHYADERRKMLYEFINSQFFVQFMLITIVVSIIGIFLLTFEWIYIHYGMFIIQLHPILQKNESIFTKYLY